MESSRLDRQNVVLKGCMTGSISQRSAKRVHPGRRTLLFVAGLLFCTGVAHAQEVGTIAAMEGTAELGRGGAWAPAHIGAAIQQGDELRTSRPGRLRVVFQDD